jgi:GNAT superfamily N-acetyltransferase
MHSNETDAGPESRWQRVLIRPAVAADAAAIARVYVESWRTTYAGIIPAAYLERLSCERQTRGWRRQIAIPGNVTLVAEVAGTGVVGFANGGPERSGDCDWFAELYVLYLLDAHQRHGIGRRLVTAFAAQLADIGLLRMLVWVLAANPARRFYQSLGGELIGERSTGVGGAKLTEVAYGWRDVRLLVPAPQAS